MKGEFRTKTQHLLNKPSIKEDPWVWFLCSEDKSVLNLVVLFYSTQTQDIQLLKYDFS